MVASFCGVVTIVTTQANDALYHGQHLMYVFFPFAIEIFDCLHQQVNNFFHQSNEMEWSTKCSSDPLLTILHAFDKQRVSIALQRVEATSIFRHVVIVGEGSFGHSVLSGFPSPFYYYYYYYYYMLLVIGGGALKHDLFQMPLCDPLWVVLF